VYGLGNDNGAFHVNVGCVMPSPLSEDVGKVGVGKLSNTPVTEAFRFSVVVSVYVTANE
jgi:hypothetical protein